MIRRTFALVVAALLLPLLALPARAGMQDFTVVNQGSAAIWYIFVSPNYSDSWEEDVLGNEVLMPGFELPIAMNGYGSHCLFDIRIEDADGYAEEFFDVDLCSVSHVHFPSNAPSAGKKNNSAGGGQEVTVINNGAAAVWYIFVSPNYSDSWEEDVLGNEVLMPGYQQTVTLTGYGSHCLFDVRIEDANGSAREYRDVNACSRAAVTFP